MQPKALAFALTLGALPFAASAADDAACAKVRMADPGWSDIASTNALLGNVLAPLGYEQDIKTLSVPIIYDSLKNDRIDAFLGSWQPAQKAMLQPLEEAGKVEPVTTNLSGVKFTLAVPSYVAAEGVTKVEDLAAHGDKFGDKIYGIEPGAAANENMHKMIDAGAYGLKGWDLVESSEQAMLAQSTVPSGARSGSSSSPGSRTR